MPPEFAPWVTPSTLSPLYPPNADLPEDATEEDLQRALALEAWVAEVWRPWAEEWAAIERSRGLYKELYGLRARLERDRDSSELVWGFGRLQWARQQVTIDYPPVTVPVEVGLDESGCLQVAPAAHTELESAFVADMPLADRSAYLALRQSDAADIDLWADSVRQDLFARLLRAVDHDGELMGQPETPGPKARLVDEWVLFVRRRQPDYIGFLEQQRDLYRNGAKPALPTASNDSWISASH
ncbi:MAG: hypothetical protein AB1505_29015 [Candidatus Latescibacterota bacterium]